MRFFFLNWFVEILLNLKLCFSSPSYFIWLYVIYVMYCSCGFILPYVLFAASPFRLSKYSVFTCISRCPSSFSHFVSCDGFFVPFPPLVVSHLIFIWEGLCMFPFPCLPLLPFSYFFGLSLLLHVKDCISHSNIYLEEQKISGEEILLFWMVLIGCISWFFGMWVAAKVVKVADFPNQMS